MDTIVIVWLIICIATIAIIASQHFIDKNIGETTGGKNKTDPKADVKKETVTRSLKFRKRYYFFTRSELAFYSALVEATSEDYIIFCKARVVDVIEPHHKQDTSEYKKALSHINQKHVDYLLLHKNLKVAAAIDLDGKAHVKPNQLKSNAIKSEAFRKANVPLIRFKVGEAFDAYQIQQKIINTLQYKNYISAEKELVS